MTDIAEVGFKADSEPLVRARRELRGVGTDARTAARATDSFTAAEGRGTRATDRMASRVALLDRVVAGFRGTLLRMGSAFLIAFSFNSAINQAREFSAATAELATIATGGIDDITAAARRMGIEFGTGAVEQVRGFYQVISAGGAAASSTAKQLELMEAANRLAIGGVTDTTTAVDILTTALNAYADVGLTAADANDILFTGVRLGKTTVTELAGSLGRVIPTATALGVSLEEVVSGVAALTTQGQSTEMAVTGINAALSQIISPASQASALAQQLGIDFSATGLQAKGLAGFLQDIVEKTHGDQTAMATLFGSIEALRAVLSFAGQGGVAFNDILDQMGDRAGAADEAFRTVSQSLDFRLKVSLSTIKDYALSLGTALLHIIVPALETFLQLIQWATDHLDILLAVVIALSPALLSMFGPPVIAAVASWVEWVGVRAVAAVRALGIAIAANPLGLILTALTTAIGLLIAFRDKIHPIAGDVATLGNYFQALWEVIRDAFTKIGTFVSGVWDKIKEVAGSVWSSIGGFIVDAADIVKNVSNTIIGLFVGAFSAVRATWSALPAVLGDVAIKAANLVVAAVEGMINGGIWLINKLIDAANLVPGVNIDHMDPAHLDRIDNPWDGAIQGLGNAIVQAFTDSLSADWIGAANDAIGNGITALFGGLRDRANAIGALANESSGAATDVQALADALGNTSDALDNVATGAAGAATGIGNVSDAAKEAAKEFAGTVKDAFMGFFQDLRQGKTFLESFANALDQIVSKFFDLWLNQIFAGFLGGGTVFSKLFSFLGFASGGYTGDGSQSAVAGVVHGQEFVVNAKATDRWRPILEAMNDNRLSPGNVGGSNIQPIRPVQRSDAPLRIVIEDHTKDGVQVRSAEQDQNGDLRIVLDQAVSDLVNDRGSKTNRTLRGNFNLAPKVATK